MIGFASHHFYRTEATRDTQLAVAMLRRVNSPRMDRLMITGYRLSDFARVQVLQMRRQSDLCSLPRLIDQSPRQSHKQEYQDEPGKKLSSFMQKEIRIKAAKEASIRASLIRRRISTQLGFPPASLPGRPETSCRHPKQGLSLTPCTRMIVRSGDYPGVRFFFPLIAARSDLGTRGSSWRIRCRSSPRGCNPVVCTSDPMIYLDTDVVLARCLRTSRRMTE